MHLNGNGGRKFDGVIFVVCLHDLFHVVVLLGLLREVGDEVVYTPPHLTHTPVAPVMSCVSLSPARTAPSSLSSLNKGFVRY